MDFCRVAAALCLCP
ncbi:hypothetical protein [Nocardiopsis sp. CA-288880]